MPTSAPSDVVLDCVLAYDRVHAEMLEAVAAGKLDGLENLIPRRVKLEGFVEKSMKALIYEKDEHVKILVCPNP
ncbi:hypothetical protein LXA43DRAFT_1098763 [Ganoderma leucocontextum]|nr:hypothetical protein LXA43DRAFT_1098763 [Ganoderma leucocontextum]